jgi:heme/copper-type cytochrome/quinol oxidase subunit 2
MSNKKLIIIAVAVVVVLTGVLVFVKRAPQSGTTTSTGGGNVSGAVPSGPKTREAAPANVVVPSEESKDVPQNVALPEVVSGNPNQNSSFRSFDIKADGNKFTPDTVIVRQEDTININVTAVDKDYDFFQPDYGIKVQIPKGATNKVQFQGTASGKFLFYCVSCGGPDKGPTGYVIIAPK